MPCKRTSLGRQGTGKDCRAWIPNAYVKTKRIGKKNREAHCVTKAHVGLKGIGGGAQGRATRRLGQRGSSPGVASCTPLPPYCSLAWPQLVCFLVHYRRGLYEASECGVVRVCGRGRRVFCRPETPPHGRFECLSMGLGEATRVFGGLVKYSKRP